MRQLYYVLCNTNVTFFTNWRDGERANTLMYCGSVSLCQLVFTYNG